MGAIILLLVAAASAYALKFELDETTVSATASVEPREFPARGNVPIDLRSVIRVKSDDGSAPLALSEIAFNIDGNGFIDTKGLPVCTMAKLAGTTPQAARKRCADAIVGTGSGKAEVRFPGKAPVQIKSPLTLFNAPPQGGRPAVIAHAYETLPVPKAVLVPFTIQKIHDGRYGFRVEIPLPKIAEGYGAATLAEATVGKTWKRGGKTVGYANAHCVGGRLQVYGRLSFADGSFFPGTLTSPCHVAN
ncbi:MAG TPA: hypothetical protein VFI03_06180 [Solirubrobacterales bacterium]|nr:hypothetical protein [Solirubrobacterales bacterium]